MELDEKSVKIERLYALHKNVMLYTAERILRDYQLAEDAVQKAFMKVLDNLHKIEESDCNKTRAFLVIITRNVAITMYNRQKKQAVPIEEIEQMDCAGGFTPFELVASKESVEAIAQYISQLDKKYADVLTLKFYYQYSDSEIAGLVQTSPENVRVRLHRGKRKLTALLKGDERFNGSQNRR